MTGSDIQWPRKMREFHNHHFDSTMWNDFRFRDNDIVISTYGKSGTTWTQQIVSQLLFNGATDIPVSDLSPWVDMRVPPREVKIAGLEAQTNRRFMKTHLPVDALVFSPSAKYLYIGRDGRDVVWSMYNHHVNGNALWYSLLNDTPGLVGPPIGQPVDSVHQYFLEWLDKDGFPWWPFWENVRSWWDVRNLPNVRLVHFNDLKADLAGQMRAIAEFLHITIDEKNWPAMLEHCSFDYMKNHGDNVAPLGGAVFEGGAKTFINKGTNGRWRDVLADDECKRYEEKARRELGDECARWLMNGGKV